MFEEDHQLQDKFTYRDLKEKNYCGGYQFPEWLLLPMEKKARTGALYTSKNAK